MAGTIAVGVDKGCLRLQFPSAVSKKLWGVKQKYLTLGLSDTKENRVMAQELANKAQKDILWDNLDISLERYKPLNLKKASEQIKSRTPELLELYTEFIKSVKKPSLDRVTYSKYEGNYLNKIKLLGDVDIVTDSTKIFNTLISITTPAQVRNLLDVLHNLLEWCKRRGIVERDIFNPYNSYKQDIPGNSRQSRPKHITEQDLVKDDDYRGYSPEEAEHIINAFLDKGKTSGLYHSLALFLFLSGCRPSEATGLQWGDISEDCKVITFCHVYCSKTKEEKGLKTKRYGKKKRKFCCGERLQNLLKEMRKKQGNPNSKSKVFLSREGNPVNWQTFYYHWVGRHDKHQDSNGIIEILAKEGKVRHYLKPYSTRHSFITWQLAHGMTPANVAKLVGNSPEMIYKHYVSADDDVKLAFELEEIEEILLES
jgi:integrase